MTPQANAAIVGAAAMAAVGVVILAIVGASLGVVVAAVIWTFVGAMVGYDIEKGIRR